MPQNSRAITMRVKSPLSPAERARRYRQALRGPRRRLEVRINNQRIRTLVKRGYLGPNERDNPKAIRQAITLFFQDSLRKVRKPR
jgi:hypothetical protein